jgi:GrpB-like predicted nucleotidyltransferase (UPF0157 family)
MMVEVRVEPADPGWPRLFEELRDRASAALGDLVVRIEHVGSTSVPGLVAKAVIDLDVVIRSRAELPAAIERLAAVGYTHVGDLGITGREAFKRPDGTPRHNLYLCAADSVELARHVRFRDYLRSHPDTATEYAVLKRELAERHRLDIDAYCEAKTAFIEGVLGRTPES